MPRRRSATATVDRRSITRLSAARASTWPGAQWTECYVLARGCNRDRLWDGAPRGPASAPSTSLPAAHLAPPRVATPVQRHRWPLAGPRSDRPPMFTVHSRRWPPATAAFRRKKQKDETQLGIHVPLRRPGNTFLGAGGFIRPPPLARGGRAARESFERRRWITAAGARGRPGGALDLQYDLIANPPDCLRRPSAAACRPESARRRRTYRDLRIPSLRLPHSPAWSQRLSSCKQALSCVCTGQWSAAPHTRPASQPRPKVFQFPARGTVDRSGAKSGAR